MKWLGYNSNNSGGSWWLKDDDWEALEAAGWTVDWVANNNEDTGRRADKNGRWLGALATNAWKQFDSAKAGIAEFERVTGQDVSDEGCNCCGPPHSFVFGDTKDGGRPNSYYDIEGRYISADDFRVVGRKELDE